MKGKFTLFFMLTLSIGLFVASQTWAQQQGTGGRSATRRATIQNVPEDAVEAVQQSMNVIQDFVSATGKNIPPEVLQNAAGIAVIPDLTKVALGVGGSHGTGVLLSHDGNQWSLPAFVSISGGSLGAQIGVSTTDVLLVFQNPNAITTLRSGGNMDFGANASVAAGPSGGMANWSTAHADVLAYTRTGGLFAGASLTGGKLSIDPKLTLEYYVGPGQSSVRGYYESGGKNLVADLLDLNENLRLAECSSRIVETETDDGSFHPKMIFGAPSSYYRGTIGKLWFRKWSLALHGTSWTKATDWLPGN